MNDVRIHPKDQIAWGWYNYGALVGIESTRRAAIKAIEEHTGVPWRKAKRYMEFHKVKVSKEAADE